MKHASLPELKMSKRWGIALMILAASLLLASPNISAAEGENPGPANDPSEYELLDPEVQLYIEQRINEKNLEDYEKIIDIKTKAIEDRFDAYKWFAIVIIALLGGGGFVLIRYMVDARISKLKPEEKIQKKVDELDETIKAHKQDIDKLKQGVEREFKRKLEEIKNIRPEEMTPEQREIVEEVAEEIKEKPEEKYSARDYFWQGFNAGMEGEYNKAIKYYQKAIELEPDFSEAYDNLGIAYNKIDKHEQAIEVLNKAIEVNPNLTTGYYNLACIYSQKKDRLKATKYLGLAIDKGYNLFRHIEQNPDLDFIRDTPEYRRIIKKLKAKKKL